jgi:hypothetical protein
MLIRVSLDNIVTNFRTMCDLDYQMVSFTLELYFTTSQTCQAGGGRMQNVRIKTIKCYSIWISS